LRRLWTSLLATRETVTDPNSWFAEARPRCNLLSSGHVRVPVALESRLELMQLDAGEVRALASPLLASWRHRDVIGHLIGSAGRSFRQKAWSYTSRFAHDRGV